MTISFHIIINRDTFFFVSIRCQVRQNLRALASSIVTTDFNAYPPTKNPTNQGASSSDALRYTPKDYVGDIPHESQGLSSVSVSKISKRTVVFVGFIIGTFVASGFAAPVAANYYQFYPSLVRIQLSLTNLQLNSSAAYIGIKGFFTVMNPTDYKGFILTVFRGSYEIDKDNITINRGASLPSPPGFITRALDKNVLIPVAVSFNATNTGANNIQVLFVVDLVLSTFLDGFGPVIVTFVCQGMGGPGSCYLATVSTQGSFAPGTGGRGGV